MADEQESPLIEWAKNQPKWQQHALRLISKYGSAEAIPKDDKDQIKKILIEETKGEEPEFVSIKETDISSAIATEPKTYFQSLGPVSNIDKLASEQKPFDFINPNGMTVIFGNNGSGKSGYARILKNLCRSHGEVRALKGDATSDTAADWEVDLTYAEKKSGEGEVQKSIRWTKTDEGKAKSDIEYIPLGRIAFFDSQVANTYVDGNRDLFYFPPELRLYAELANLADELKKGVEKGIEDLENRLPNLPKTTLGTPTHNIISKLESQEVSELSQEDVASICVFSEEEKQELRNLRMKEANTPEQREAILKATNETLIKLNDDMKKSDEVLSSKGLRQLLDNHQNYQDAKTKAEENITDLAAEMPINEGLGSDVWFEMFKAARKFAGEVYPDKASPAIANAEHCVLCHQALEKEARQRLKQFDDFINDKLQTTADEAKKVLNEGLEAISSLPNLDSEAIKQQLQQYAGLSDANKPQVETITTDLKAIASRRDKFNQIIELEGFGGLQTLIAEKINLRTDISSLIDQIITEEKSLNVLISKGQGGLISEEQHTLSDLEDKSQCALQGENIRNFFDLVERIKHLNNCKQHLKPRPITDQSKRRSKVLFSDDLKTRYEKEIKRLGIKLNISIGDHVYRGAPKIEAGIENLNSNKNSEILSEGEQRAVALAGFLTEVNEVDIGHAIIFDDPVSSLDLVRKNQIAKRLVEEAKNRQIIIFTHDHSFLLALQHHCEAKNIVVQNQWICQKDGQWGITGDTAVAWQIKSVEGRNSRIVELEESITTLKQDEASGISDSKFDERATKIATKLREAWERAVEEIVFYGAVQRYSPVIQTQRLSRVKFDGGGDDYAKFHEGFSGVVNESPHDSAALVPKLLTSAELEENLQQLKEWIEEIKGNRPPRDSARNLRKEENRLGG